jgi:hypothetical protein
MHPLVWLGIVLLVVWALLWLGFQVVSGIVHLLALVAAALIVWGLVRKGASAVSSRM